MISQIISIIILLWVGEDDILCVWALGLNDSIYAERGMTFVILKRQLLNATSFFIFEWGEGQHVGVRNTFVVGCGISCEFTQASSQYFKADEGRNNLKESILTHTTY